MKSSIKKVLAIVLTGIVVVSLASCSVTDKVQEYFKEETTVTEPYTNKSEKPDTQAEVVKYFNAISADLKKSNPYNITMSRDFSANDFESQNEHLKAAFPTVANFLIDNSSFIEKGLNGKEAIDAGTISNIAHVYPIEGSMESSNVLLKQVKLATCSQTADNFVLTIDFKDDAAPLEAGGLGEVFNINDKDAILEELKGASDLITVKDYDVEYNGGRIVCTVERETDRIVSATYSRIIKITADITGQGEFSSVKNEKVTFNITENENYTIEWDAPVETTVAEK
ncbi:MAG: hypothetical protein IJ279_03765 [Clostridia bacterium]|nr:hypothetical protein [Clostridia bacterium]